MEKNPESAIERSAAGNPIELFSVMRTCTIRPLSGKYQGMLLNPGWRRFDHFGKNDQRKTMLLPDGSTIPVSELEGVKVELMPDDEE